MWLPQAERRGEIQFYLAKSLPYGYRMAISLSLMALGLALQSGLGGGRLWLGLGLVLAGVVMLLSKGYENIVDESGSPGDWRTSRADEVRRILEINRRQKQWDQDAVDITCGRGITVIVVAAILVALIALFALFFSKTVAFMVAANAAVVLIPFWVTGVRFILKNDQLVIKTEILLALARAFEKEKRDGEEFQFQMRTSQAANGSGEAPHDLKGVLLFHNGPPEFLGVQMQVTINNVQGKDYPYFYCVLVARREFGGLNGDKLAKPPRSVILEPETETDVDIVVIRRRTTRRSGYHTGSTMTRRIFRYALRQARGLVAGATA